MKHPIFLNSMPKSGTHLLSKALIGLPGVGHSGAHLERKKLAEFVDEGVDFPVEGREDIHIQQDFIYIERLLKSVPPGQFITAHMKYHRKIDAALKGMKYKILLMVRDPRDVVLSWADYIASEKSHLLHPFFRNTDVDYRISCGIEGVGADATGTRRQPPISELIMGHIKWKTEGEAFLVRFEDLIGERGGGSRSMQISVLMRLAEFLGVQFQKAQVESICDSLFGGTYTFNAGMIGRWRSRFTEKHKSLFKAHAGRLLIDMGYEQDLNW